MKKLLVLAAFVATPILYGQQKPSATDLQKSEIIQTEQARQARSSDAKLTEQEAVAREKTAAEKKAVKASQKTDAKATRKSKKLSDADLNKK